MKKTILSLFIYSVSIQINAQNFPLDSLTNYVNKTINTEKSLESSVLLANYYAALNPERSKFYINNAKKFIDNNSPYFIKLVSAESKVYETIGDYEKQTKIVSDAASKIDTINKPQQYMDLLYLLGKSQTRRKDYEGQRRSFTKAYNIAQNESNLLEQVKFLNGIGYSYKLENNYEKALEFYNRGLQLFTETQDTITPSIIHANLLGNSGLVYTHFQNYDEALRRFRKSKSIRKKANNLGHFAGSHLDIAELYFKKQNLDSAIYYNKEAIKIAQTIDGREWMSRGHKNLSEIFQTLNSNKKAFYHYKKHDSIGDLSVNAASLKKMAYLQAEIDYEKKLANLTISKDNIQKTSSNRLLIILLFFALLALSLLFNWLINKKNKKIAVTNTLLKDSNDEKDMLLKEIHHRVKNNLQLVSSLLSLQSRSVENRTFKGLLQDGNNRIKSMAFVHQKLYEKGNYNEVDFKHYISQVIKNLIASYEHDHPIAFSVKSTELVSIDFATSIGLIINEIVTNAIKYNHTKENLKIEVSFKKDKKNYHLIVQDNGKGFDKNELDKNNSLGTRLIEILTNQLEGKLELETSKDKGVAYNINFPNT